MQNNTPLSHEQWVQRVSATACLVVIMGNCTANKDMTSQTRGWTVSAPTATTRALCTTPANTVLGPLGRSFSF